MRTSLILLILFVSLLLIGCVDSRATTFEWDIGEKSEVVYTSSWRDGGSMGFTITDTRVVKLHDFCILNRKDSANRGYSRGVFYGALYPDENSVIVPEPMAFLYTVLETCIAEVGRDAIERTLSLETDPRISDEDYEMGWKWFNQLPRSHQHNAGLGARILSVYPEVKEFEQGDID